MDWTDVLLKPILTEKTTMLKDSVNQVAFLVQPGANQLEVREAVEKAFDVKVKSVNIVRRKPLNRERQGRVIGRKSGFKKAYVMLEEGEKIEFFVGSIVMAVRKLKPTSAGRRFQTVSDFEEITRTTPEKSLTEGLPKKAGRNNRGRVTSRRRGGGVKRLYRVIDFKRNKIGIPATVAEIEYDPNRTARIALLHYADGEKRYILAPVGLKQGDVVMSGVDARTGTMADIKPGNALEMAKIPVGTVIHNIELSPGRGGQICRSAGTYAQLVAKEGNTRFCGFRQVKSEKSWQVALLQLDR